MFRFLTLFSIIFVLSSCNSGPSIEGFDSEKWRSTEICSDERVALAELIEANEKKLLSYTQPDIEALLGLAPRHELFNRNEKFFYYPIQKGCEGSVDRSLFFRFDALGRTKEVIIIFD
jgi:hypothetical protein